MIDPAVRDKVREIHLRHTALMQQLYQVVRSLPAVLKDHGLANTAKPLEEVLFQIEAWTQESAVYVQEHMDALIAGLRGE